MLPELADAGQRLLSDSHRRMLEEASAIRPEVIAARGCFTEADKRNLERIGHAKANGRVPCLVVPLHSADGETVIYQIRPDTPPVNAEGETAKYLLPKGARLVVDCNPIARPDVLNPDVPLWITEGAKKADSAISRSLACVSISGVDCWQQGKVPLPEWYQIPMKARPVYVAFDSDAMTKREVWFALKRFTAFLRSRGAAVQIVYLPAGEDGAKVGLDDFFAGGGTVTQLKALAEKELRPLPRIGIETNNRQHRDIIDGALKALREANDPPALFIRGGRLTRIALDENCAATLETNTLPSLRERLTRAADWIATTVNAKGETTVRETHPPRIVVEDLLELSAYEGFPPLLGIVAAPIFAPDGSLSLTPGYHAGSRTFFHSPTPLTLPDTNPTPGNVEAAKRLLLNDLLGDFPFADAASRAQALAYLLLGFVRPLITGPTPLHLFGAPRSRTGKSLCCELCAAVFTGRAPMAKPATTDEETGKALLAYLLSGQSHIIYDNVRSLNYPSLMAAITAQDYSDRILGVSRHINLPVRVVWAATANNLTANDEITGRSVWIHLDAGIENPEERQEFRHADIRAWAMAHRAELIGAALTLCRAWIAANRPAYSGENGTLGNFESWVAVMGGLLETVGVPGFLGNRAAWRERADTDSEAWRGFVTAWYEAQQDKPVPAAALFALAQFWLPEKLGEGSEHSQRSKLGRLLIANTDRIYADKKIVRSGVATSGANKGQALYRLLPPNI